METFSFFFLFQTDGKYLIEVDRVLKPGGYFVWTSPLTNTQGVLHKKENQKRWNFIQEFVEYLCWEMLPQQDETVVWKKTSKSNCYSSRYGILDRIHFTLYNCLT